MTKRYQDASVILEYGSGGSTRIAAQMEGKRVFSVESDLKWALELQAEIDNTNPKSLVTLYPVDVGETGPWGRPLSEKNWRRFYTYPMSVWDEPFFRQPDLVLIDGRMRCACLMTVMMRITSPVIVLFDDYGARKLYREVEALIKPVQTVGTMAEFHLEPGMIKAEDLTFAIRQFSLMSIYGCREEFYQLPDATDSGTP